MIFIVITDSYHDNDMQNDMHDNMHNYNHNYHTHNTIHIELLLDCYLRIMCSMKIFFFFNLM